MEVKGFVIIGMVKPELLISMLGYEDIDNTAKEMEIRNSSSCFQ